MPFSQLAEDVAGPAAELTGDATLAAAEAELGKLQLAPILLPYELRCYWWEAFECARKLSIVGLPVFFEPGSSEQLAFGLLICFITVAVFEPHRPMRDASDNVLQLVCLVEVFQGG